MNQIPSIVCCFRTGGEYKPEHVEALYKQTCRQTTKKYNFVCYTDYAESFSDGITVIPLEKNYPGWWSCVELWRHQGPSIIIGLDTMFIGNIDHILQLACDVKGNEFLLLESFWHLGQYINGMQIWNGDWSWLYKNFNYEKQSTEYRGDENYQIESLMRVGVSIGRIQMRVDGVYSYKDQYLRGKAKDPRVLIFYGKDKPWKVPSLWRPANK